MAKGMGVMINEIIDALEPREETPISFLNKEIISLKMTPDGDGELQIEFSDGVKIAIYDDGRSCCESRYMMTDDKLEDFVGAKLLDMAVLNGPEINDSEWGDVHETQFLIISTSKGRFTMVTHNEHNGYYGGFYLRIRLIK